MPKPKPDDALSCPVCSSCVNFNLSLATIRSQSWTQTYPHRFKLDSRAPKHTDFQTPLILSCCQCGHAMPVPADIAKQVKTARQ